MATSYPLQSQKGLSKTENILKRAFDVCLSFIGLLCFGWLILICFVLATIDTRQNGFFTQTRVGKEGNLFRVVKIRTMRSMPSIKTTVTSVNDPRITPLGTFFRRYKLDELPQLWNVLKGEMSFVGPRPDVPGFADTLTGDERLILSIRPGITGPATLHFRNEEQLLAQQDDPETFNRDVIYPKKVQLNLQYIQNYRLSQDLHYIWQTVAGS